MLGSRTLGLRRCRGSVSNDGGLEGLGVSGTTVLDPAPALSLPVPALSPEERMHHGGHLECTFVHT